MRRPSQPVVIVLDPASFTPYYDADLAGALQRAGWRVEWISSHWEFEDVSPPPGVAVEHAFFPALRRPALARLLAPRRHATLRRALKGALYPLDAMRLRRTLLAREPGILHVQWAHLPWLDARVWIALRRAGWVVVHTVHDIEPLAGSSTGPLRLGTLALHAAADAIVVHDEAARGRLVAGGVPAARVHVVTPGAPAAHAGAPSRDTARTAFGIAPGAKVVLFFGFVKPYKGLGVLLESVARLVARLPDVALLVAGEVMGCRAPYDRAIARLGIAANVRFRGAFVPSAEVATYFAAADVVALPYLDASSSAVLLTAHAHARPVVATTVGGLPVLVEHGRSGLLVPPRDPARLAGALEELLTEPARAARMGEHGRLLVEQRHSWELVARQHAALYRELWATLPSQRGRR